MRDIINMTALGKSRDWSQKNRYRTSERRNGLYALHTLCLPVKKQTPACSVLPISMGVRIFNCLPKFSFNYNILLKVDRISWLTWILPIGKVLLVPYDILTLVSHSAYMCACTHTHTHTHKIILQPSINGSKSFWFWKSHGVDVI